MKKTYITFFWSLSFTLLAANSYPQIKAHAEETQNNTQQTAASANNSENPTNILTVNQSAPSSDTSSSQDNTQSVDSWMPDKNLQKEMQDLLPKGDTLTPENMAKITSANLSYSDISNLSGLEYATNLTSLDLTGNNISDITPLGKLNNLKDLSLRLNKSKVLPDLQPLSNSNISSLNLVGDSYGTQLKKLAPISTLDHLTKFSLTNAKLTQLPVFSTKAPLDNLDLSGNQISDVSSLANFKTLTSLSLGANKISDFKPISYLTNLTTLIIGNNPQKNITVLSSLTNLKKAILSQLALTNSDLNTLLPNMKNLENLGIDFNSDISDLSALSNLTNLNTLDFGKDSVSDLTPLKSLIQLKDLELTNNKVSDLSPLKDLINLTTINLLRNKVYDISPLGNLKYLTSLNVRSQNITSTLENGQQVVVKDIDGTIIPLTSEENKDTNTSSYSWKNTLAKNKLSTNFSGAIIQPIKSNNDSDTGKSVNLSIMKGDNASLTSVAANYIQQDANLKLNADGSGTLLFKAIVPSSYGKNSITFKNAKQTSISTAGDNLVLNYSLDLTKNQLAQPTVLENMHVDFVLPGFSYNYFYDINFKIDKNSTNSSVNNNSQEKNEITQNQTTKPVVENKVISKSTELSVMRSDDITATSVAAQYIQPNATLNVNSDGSAKLLFTAKVPTTFGKNSLTFKSAKQVDVKQSDDSYIMYYELPLTANDLSKNAILENMHVVIHFPGFDYDNIYDVYFKLKVDNTTKPDVNNNTGNNTDKPNVNNNTGKNTAKPNTNNNTGKNTAKPNVNNNTGKNKVTSKDINLSIAKGDNANATSVAAQYIQPKANLKLNSNGSGKLYFTAKVPANFGKNSITFKNAKQLNVKKVGNSYVMYYELPLTAKQLTQTSILENMHVVINLPGFNYNHFYNVNFKLKDVTSTKVQSNNKKVALTKNVANSKKQNVITNNFKAVNMINNSVKTQQVKLDIMRSDNPNQVSVAAQYIQPNANLKLNANGSGILYFTAKVPTNFGKNSLTFKSAKQINIKQVGNSYIMEYELPLTKDQLAKNTMLESMHVDIKIGSFIYNHFYDVYFKLTRGAISKTNQRNVNNASFSNANSLLTSNLVNDNFNNASTLSNQDSVAPFSSTSTNEFDNNESSPVTTNLSTTSEKTSNLTKPDQTSNNNFSNDLAANLPQQVNAATREVNTKSPHQKNVNSKKKANDKKAPIKSASNQAVQSNQINTPQPKDNVKKNIIKASVFAGSLMAVVGIYFARFLKK